MHPVVIGLIFTFVGLFSLAGGVLDWNWFMNHYRSRFMTHVLGRSGARIFYSVLGIALVVLGLMIAMGVVDAMQFPEGDRLPDGTTWQDFEDDGYAGD